MFKNKYIKYKNKYLSLQASQKGGHILNVIHLLFDDKEKFKEWYIHDPLLPVYEDAGKFFLILKNYLYTTTPIESIEPINILVGASCTNNTDYLRFKDSDIYSLYIDEISPLSIIKNNTITEAYIEKYTEEYTEGNFLLYKNEIIDRQYNMFTITYNIFEFLMRTNLITNILLKNPRFKNIIKFNKIHFDKNVSYFTSIKDEFNYLNIAQAILIEGGKIIWDVGEQHQSYKTYTYSIYIKKFLSPSPTNPSTYKGYPTEYLNDTYSLNIDVETKTFTLREDFFKKNRMISPQLSIKLMYTENNIDFDFIGDTTVGYVDYLNVTYPSITFEEKIYSYTNYTYPVPIRFIDENYTINVLDDFLNYVFNKIMTVEERITYIDSRHISDEFLEEILSRITSSHEAVPLYNEAILRIICQSKPSIIRGYLEKFIELDIIVYLIIHKDDEPFSIPNYNIVIRTYLYSAFKKEYKFIEGTKN